MSTANENSPNKEVIETARLAWNELSVYFDDPEVTFKEEESEAFTEFYRALVDTLFEEETTE